MSAGGALLSLNKALHDPSVPYLEAALGDQPLRLSKKEHAHEEGIAGIDGHGGFKTVYGLEDGRAIATLNLDALQFKSLEEADQWAATWERGIKEEKAVSDKVRAAGLEAQQIEILPLKVGNDEVPVMVMPRFAEMAKHGAQVRDIKNPRSSCGSSMFFGTPQNVENPDRLKLAMQALLDDAVIAISHGIDFGGDARNLVVKDTEQTPRYNRDELGLFDERKQQVRFFLFDFASKHGPRDEQLPQLLDATGNPDQKQIAETAEYYVGRAYETLLDSMKSDEIDRILELKKSFPSKHQYDRYDIYDVFNAHFETMKDEMIKDVSARVTKEIAKLPIQERLARFSRPEGSPPLEIQRADGNTWGAGAPPKDDGFAQRLG
jgi:hypothetical protein